MLIRPGAGGQARITGVSMTEAIAQELMRAILTGSIAPGEFLREVDLAERFGVSRQSVRAAMMEMSHLGVLHHEAHRGFMVPQLTQQDLDEIFDIRTLIERDAVRKLALDPVATNEPAAALERLHALPPDSDRNSFYELHFEFHRSLVAAAEPARLVKFFDSLSTETWLLLLVGATVPVESPASQRNRTHEEILDAIRQGDPERAAEYAERHLAYGREQAVLSVSGGPVAPSPPPAEAPVPARRRPRASAR